MLGILVPLPEQPAPPRRPPLVRSTLGTFGTQLAVAALSLLNVLIVARVLGAEGRGEVAFLGTIAFLTSQLASLGVHQANANLAGREPGLRPALATNSALLALLLGGAAAIVVEVLVALVPAVGGGLPDELRLWALASIPMLVFQTLLAYLVRADYGFRAANASLLVVPVTTAGVNGVLAAAGVLTVGRAFGSWVAGQVLATIVLAVYVHRRLAGFGRPDAALARRALVFGVKTHGGRVMLLGNYKLDQWLVGSIAGQRELGLYSIAVTWAETLFYLPTALAGVQRADLVRATARDAGRRAAAGFRATALASAPLAVGLVVAAPILCVGVFGEEFRGSVDDMRVLVPGALGVIALKVLGDALTAQRKPLLETAAIGVAFAVILVLDVLLIPAYGGLGAALASTAAYTAGGLVVAALFSRGFDLPAVSLLPRGNELPWFWAKARAGLTGRSVAADVAGEEPR